MARCRCSLMFLNAACFVLLRLRADFGPLVVIGFIKVVACLALTCLLAFVVVHSANIGRLLIARLHGHLVCFSPLAVESSMGRATTDSYHRFNEPCLGPLFQRPPPFLSL
jgi:hypothetical protein